MSGQTKGSREDGRPDILVFLDASDGPLDVPKFAHRVGVVSAFAEDGTPIVKDSDEGTFDYRNFRWHDLQQKTSQGLPDRRLAIQHFVDFDAEYADDREGDAPYEQKENFTALNRTSRWADGSGRVALPTSFTRLIGSEDGRDAVALAIRGPLMGEPDEVDVTTDPDELNALGLPEGVSFHGTGSVGGTGGTVTATQPRVVVGGLSFFGQASVEAAAKVARAGGSITQIRDAARAAAFGQPPPPFTPEGTRTRPPAPVRNKAGSVVPNNHPLGYMWEEGVNRIGLMGTLFTAGSLDKDVLYFTGREGTPINRLAMRHDGHVAMSETRTGRVHYAPTEISNVPEGDGDLIKGWMMHDASKANEGTEVGQETGQWRPTLRVGLKDITTRNPPPPFVQPKEQTFVDPGRDPEEEIIGSPGTTSGGNTEELSDDGRFVIVRSPTGTVLEVRRVSGGILSPVQVGVAGGGGAPGPSVTATGTTPGHLAIVPSPVPNQILIGIAAPPDLGVIGNANPIGNTGFDGLPPLGLPGAPGTGGPIDNTGFEGPLPLGLPGGAGGGVGFEPQPESGGLTDAQADAANAAREAARAEARDEALEAEQRAINDLRAKGEEIGGPRGRRMQERADRAQKNRDRREERRQKREDYKRRKKEERERRKREREARRKKKKEQREAAVAAANAAADERRAEARAEAKATGLYGSIGYAVDMTDPEAPVTFGDSGLAAQDEAERKRALGGGSGLGSLGTVGGGLSGGGGAPPGQGAAPPKVPNTATTVLLAPGSPGGPKNMLGYVAMATYAINSQQVMTTGAFGGGGKFLNAPINVVEVVESKPGQPAPAPSGSTLGQQIIAASGTRTVFGTPALNVIGGVHAAPGSTVRVSGAGVFTVSRPHTGGGVIVDERPGVLVAGKSPRPGTPTGKTPDAIQVGDDRRFHVGYGGEAKASKLAIVQAPGELGHPLSVGQAGSAAAAGDAEIGTTGGDFYVDGRTGAATSNVALIATGGDGLAGVKTYGEDVDFGGGVRVVASTTEHAEADGTEIGTSIVLGSVLVAGELAVSVIDAHADTLTMISPTGSQTEIVSEKVTCDVLDPYVVIMVPVAARPAELVAGTPGYWSELDGGGAGIHTGWYYDGSADVEVGGAGGGGSTFADNAFRVTGSADATKRVAFEVDGLTTATTRTLTVQDASGTIALLDVAQDWTAAQTVLISDASVAGVTEFLVLEHETSGTPQAGYGAGIGFYLHDDANVLEPAGKIQVVWSDATTGSEDADFVVLLERAGVGPGEKFRATSEGVVVLPEHSGTPASPATNRAGLFFGTDGLLRSIDDGGVVTPYVGGGGGSGTWTTWTGIVSSHLAAVTWTGKYLIVGKLFYGSINGAYSGATTAANLTIDLPAGVTADTTVPFPFGGGGGYDGVNIRGNFGVGLVDNNTLEFFYPTVADPSIFARVSNAAPFAIGAGDNLGFTFVVAIT